MEVKLIKDIVPNSNPSINEVEYIVLHSSSGPASRIIDIFNDPKQKKSCHFVIDEDGSVYQTLEVERKRVTQGWHAGRSLLTNESGLIRSEFNDFSIGIELVNKNCNIYKYKPQLFNSLVKLVKDLKKMFPALSSPDRIIGHEHISGFRGKVDPGHMFDWKKFYRECYNKKVTVERSPRMSKEYKNLLTQVQTVSGKNGVKQQDIDSVIRQLTLFYQQNLGVSKLPI